MLLTACGPPMHLPCRRRGVGKGSRFGVDKNLTAARSETYQRKAMIGRENCRGNLFGAEKDIFSRPQKSLY